MKWRYTYLLFLILGIYSCGKEQDIATILIELDTFSKIELNDVFIVHLSEDTVNFVEIVADGAIIDNVEHSLENETLTFWNETSLDWVSPRSNKVHLHIHSLPLNEISANETCDIVTTNPITSNEFGLIMKGKANEATLDLDCNIFYYWNDFPSGGRLSLSGTTNELKLWTHALMTVDARDLLATQALVENNSKGNCVINVSEILNYSIRGTGDILLYGSPPVVVADEITSTGELIVF